MKNTIIGVVSISFSEAFMISQRSFKIFYFLGGNCEYENEFQCPETNKCIFRSNICNNYDSCGDGSDELHCNGKATKILSIYKSIY